MARGGKKAKKLQAEISMLEIKKRNGMMIAVAAFVGMAVLIALKLGLQETPGFEWLQESVPTMTLFVLAAVAAGIAGIGTRGWKKAKDKLDILKGKRK